MKTQISSNTQLNSAQLVSWSNSLSPQRKQLPDIQIILKWMIRSDPGRLVWVTDWRTRRLKTVELIRVYFTLLFRTMTPEHTAHVWGSRSPPPPTVYRHVHTHAAKEHVNTKSTVQHTHTHTPHNPGICPQVMVLITVILMVSDLVSAQFFHLRAPCF